MTYWEQPKDWFEEYQEREQMIFTLCGYLDIDILKKHDKIYQLWLQELKRRHRVELDEAAKRKHQIEREKVLKKLSPEEKNLLGIKE